MNGLKEHILEDDLIRNLYDHVCAEFKFWHNFYPYVLESLGKFSNADIVIRHIVKDLKKDFRSKMISCENYDTWFSKISIDIDNRYESSARYVRLHDGIVYIEIGCSSQDHFNKHIEDYETLLLHELLHGYEDYNRIKNTGESIHNYLTDIYKTSFINLNYGDKTNKLLSRCNYLLNDQERNAYMSELETDIDKIFRNENIEIEDFDYSYFKEKLKSTGIWKAYFELSKFIFMMKDDKLTDNDKQHIEDTWKHLYKEDISFNAIKDKLYNNWRKFEKKFEQLVSKIVCKHIDVRHKKIAFDASLFDDIDD